jgi:two-component system phosphate regulon sensor histidine kinase PhoR
MKKKIIILLSVAICACTIILVIVQGNSLRAAGKMQKANFNSKMEVVLGNVVADAEIVVHEYDEQPIVHESFGKNSYRSIKDKTNTVWSNAFSATTERKSSTLNVNKSDASLATTDKSLKKLIEGGILGREADLNFIKDDFSASDNFSARMFVDEIKEQKVTIEMAPEERISLDGLDSLIRKQFKLAGITTSFEFSVRDANNTEIAALTTPNFRADRLERLYTENLFPYDSEQAPKYYLSIYVPHLTDYIFKELWLVIFSSLVLILIIIGTFAATLIIIFHQKRLSQMRNDFMGNMTHELKTPIATISLASEMLRDENVPNEKKNIAGLSKMIRDEAQRLSSLVEKVLRMAAFERGNVNLKHKDVNIKTIVRKVVDSYMLQFDSKKAKIMTQYNATDNIVVGDEMHLQQIISNLIDNALKYSEKNPEISIRTENKNDGIIIAVSDNGIGIEKEYLKHVFEQFYRVPTGNIYTVKGSGLGLNYVKQIAEMHGGKVSVESEKGKGSTFKIFLPNKKLNT